MPTPAAPAAAARPDRVVAGFRGRVRLCAPLGALLAVSVVLCLPGWMTLTRLWGDSFAYAHGWLIALVSAYLLSEVAPQLPVARRPTWASLAVVLVVALLYAAGGYAHVDIVQQLLLPVVPLTLVGTVYGRAGVRLVAFPLLFVWLAVPVWDAFIPVLQHLTVLANGVALSWLRIPASIDGDLVRVPAGVFEVAGGCSGEHFFVVALAVGVLYGYLRQAGLRSALPGVALALALALLTNWLRVLVIIVRGNQTHMQTTLIHDHYWFGWGLFAAALAVYFAVLHLIHREPLPPAPALPAVAPPWPALAGVVPGVAVLAAVAGYAVIHSAVPAAGGAPDLTPPTLAGAYSGPLLQDGDFRPLYSGAAAERLATYQGSGGRVTYYQVAYLEQHSGAKLIGYGSSLAPEAWRIVAEATVATPGGAHGGLPAALTESRLISGAGRQWRVWSWYSIGDHATASARSARLWQAAQLLTPVRPARLSAIAAPCVPDCDAALRSMAGFAAILADSDPLMTHQNLP